MIKASRLAATAWLAALASLVAPVAPRSARAEDLSFRLKLGGSQVYNQDTWPHRGDLGAFTGALDGVVHLGDSWQLIGNATRVFNSANSYLLELAAGPGFQLSLPLTRVYAGVLLGMLVYRQGDILDPTFVGPSGRFDVSRFGIMPTVGADVFLLGPLFANASIQYMFLTESGNGLSVMSFLAGVGVSL